MNVLEGEGVGASREMLSRSSAACATLFLKDLAKQNIALIFVTLDTFQLLSGWLKDVACAFRVGDY